MMSPRRPRPTGSKTAATIALAGALLWGFQASAVHDVGLFELDVVLGVGDGNTIDEAAPGDDWENVFNGTSGAFATAFINDSFANGVIPGFESRTPEVSFFTGGGSKDTLCLQDPCESTLGGAGGPWLYDTVNDVVPDKNDIVTAFAAAYDDPDDGHTIFYFGLDTYSVQGAANAGFWFFRRPVTLNPLADGETQGTFSGDHTDGDIFVSVAYEQGGKVGLVEVYGWDDTIGPGNKPLGPQLLVSSADADCASAGAGDDVCGVINLTPGEDPPWDYLNKNGDPTYESAAFVEFGLDITELLGEEIGCFSTFLAETRSSPSLTAQLKDFALGAFPVCDVEVDKTGDDLSKVGDEASYTITIENTGRATLYAQDISDSLLGDIVLDGVDQGNPNVDSNTCGASLAPDTSCTIELSYTVQAGDVVVDEFGDTVLPNEVSIVYTEFDDFTGIAFDKSDTHTVNLFEPAISFDKSGAPTLLLQGGTVNYLLTLTNESSDDTPSLDCTISDPVLGIDQQVVLANAPVEIADQKLFLDPANDPSCVDLGNFECTNTASVSCTPQGFENLLEASDSVTVTVIPRVVALTVTKTGDQFSKVGDTVDYEIVITNETALELTLDSISDTLLGDLAAECPASLAAAGELGDSCTINVSYVVQAGDDDPLPNTVTVMASDGFGGTADGEASWDVDLVHPDLVVSKSCASDQPVPAGASANFQIRIENGQVPSNPPFGDVELEVDVFDPAPFTPALDLMDVMLGTAPAGGCLDADFGNAAGTADAADGCYQLEGGIIATGDVVTNQVDVTATLPVRFGLDNVLERSANAECEVQQQDQATRTWGFWKTHGSDGPIGDPSVDRGYTCHIFEDHLGGLMNLGWKQVTECSELFAIFWAHRAQESDGEKRDLVCQAQVRCSGQVAAALLNTGLDNGAPLDPDDLTAVLDALTNGTRQQINQACAPIAGYNESFDDVMIVDLDGTLIPHADPNGTRSEADTAFADCAAPASSSTTASRCGLGFELALILPLLSLLRRRRRS